MLKPSSMKVILMQKTLSLIASICNFSFAGFMIFSDYTPERWFIIATLIIVALKQLGESVE